MEEKAVVTTLELEKGYRFRVKFDMENLASLILDEPPPLGEAAGPNASRILSTAVGKCLAASLTYCLRRSRAEVKKMSAEVTTTISRNEKGRLRVTDINVKLTPSVGEEDQPKLERCIGLFEDFCTVSQSVKNGINIHVEVKNASET